jgi:RNA polymerase sigma factor for flagellar operon FliA
MVSTAATAFAAPALPAEGTRLDAEDHLWLVERVAKKIARRLPPAVDVQDLIGAGTLGLLDAISRYDATRAGSFIGYAEIRIRGAILDHLRAMDWLPRSMRVQMRRTAEADRRLRNDLGRAPERAELASALGVDEEDASLDTPTFTMLSVEDLREGGFETSAVEETEPNHALERQERKARLTHAISALPLRHRQVLALYHVEELTLKQIGAIFGVTESRACQIHRHALSLLRTALLDDADLG